MRDTPSPETGKNTIVDDEIMSLVPEQFREGVLSGEYTVEPRYRWYNPDKPVIVSTDTHRIRSGRYINANNPAVIGRASAYKQTSSYRQMLETIVPLDGNKDKRGSFAWLLEQFHQACEGSPQLAPCPHPDICPQGGKPHVIAFKKEPAPMFKLIELMAGKAKETQEVNVNTKQLLSILNDNVPITEITVIDLPPEQARERKMLMEDNK